MVARISISTLMAMLLLSTAGCQGIGLTISVEALEALEERKVDITDIKAKVKHADVLVVFEKVEGTMCPVDVVTLDGQCHELGITSSEYVCRWVENKTGKADALKKVTWRSVSSSTAKEEFTIDLPSKPCKGQTSDGPSKIDSNSSGKAECKAKPGGEIGLPDSRQGQALVVKYTVTADTSCEPLDPYIIFRR